MRILPSKGSGQKIHFWAQCYWKWWCEAGQLISLLWASFSPFLKTFTNNFKLCKQKAWCELKLMIPAAFTYRTYGGPSVSRSTQNNTLPPSPGFPVGYWSTARLFIQLSKLFQPVALSPGLKCCVQFPNLWSLCLTRHKLLGFSIAYSSAFIATNQDSNFLVFIENLWNKAGFTNVKKCIFLFCLNLLEWFS